MRHRSKVILFFIISIAISSTSFGQGEPTLYPSRFKATTPTGSLSGYFHHLDSSGLYYAETKMDLRQASSIQHIPLDQVQDVGLRKKGSAGKGIGIGLLVGIGTSIIAGQLFGSPSSECSPSFIRITPCSRGEMTSAFMVPSTLLGALIGGIAGGSEKKFVLGGSKKSLRSQEAKIQKFSYLQ